MSMSRIIKRAVKLAGGPSVLARELNLWPSAVTNWIRRGQVPPEYVLAIEGATGGQVTRYQLRPDIYGKK